jgi:aminoglycoside phosphotransferase (APT) family kinase protein
MSDLRDVALARSLRHAGDEIPQPWERLADWLGARGHDASSLSPRQFAGGVANLNYLVRVDGRDVVLRRPPSGALAEGASDMAREARVLATLPSHFPLAPHALAACDDLDVLGAPFQLLEYRPGISIGSDLPLEWRHDVAVPDQLVDALLTAMADLHALDVAELGLDTLGKPGFLNRQVEGWSRRAHVAYDGHPPVAVARVVDSLRQRLPAEPARPSLLHCDLKLDNMLFDPDSRLPVAVIDWDMTTTGDPLFDLGVLLAYWVEPSDPGEVLALRQVPSLQPGFPVRAEVAGRYLDRAGREETDLSFYLTLGRLRLALAWRQLFVLHRRGTLTDTKYAAFDDIATAVLGWTAETLNDPIL